MNRVILLLAFAVSAYAHADEPRRSAIVARIIAAQGLQQMFEQQQTQFKTSAERFGKDIFHRMLSDLGVPDSNANPELRQAFSDYLDRCSSMFSASELVATWTSFYGKDLSEDDLTQILAYYESPVGRKDIQASQAAMIGFTQAIDAESQKRMQQSISKLVADMKAATSK